MSRSSWTEQQREQALLALHDGATLGQVHADTGIPKGTLASWKRRQGEADRRRMTEELQGADPEGYAARTAAAEQRAQQTAAARQRREELDDDDRKQLAARMRDEVHQLLDRINAPTTYRHVKVVNQGGEMGQVVEVVDVDVPLPNAQDTKALTTAAAILVDKLQLLTGEATERVQAMGAEPLDLDHEYRELVDRARRGELEGQGQA